MTVKKTTKAKAPVWTVRETKVDRKTVLRDAVEVTECMCPVCAYDPVRANKGKFLVETYAELDDEGKMIARNVLKKHDEHHDAAERAASDIRNAELSARMNLHR